MPDVEIKDKNNNIVGKLSLRDDIFGAGARQGVIHASVINYLANQRQGTHATKTRGLISGGGKKPWRQKHTGRARSGSIRSPLWRGGGTVFGPQPRDYSYSLPRKVRKLALMAAFREKLSNGEVVIIDDLPVEKPRTKDMLSIMKNLGLEGKSVLVVLSERKDSIILSARNIPRVSVTRAMDLNTYDVMKHDVLLITEEAAARLEELKES